MLQYKDENMKFLNLNRHAKIPIKKSRRKRWILWSLGVVVIIVALGVATYLPAKRAYASALKLQESFGSLSVTSVTNFHNLQTQLQEIEKANNELNSALRSMPWLGVIPHYGKFYDDAKHLSLSLSHMVDAVQLAVLRIEPYADELGLTSVTTDESPNRILQLTQVLGALTPEMDNIIAGLKLAEEELAFVDPSDYPDELRGYSVKPRLIELQTGINHALTIAENAKPTLQVMSSLLGVSEPKTYLLVFQNDKELRATGGFLSSYSYIHLDKGEISTTASHDIYSLNNKIVDACKYQNCDFDPPPAIKKYLRNDDGSARTFWSILDVNLSPDVPTSMADFERMYAVIPNTADYDGIILVDTHVVEELLKFTGPITIDGTEFSLETEERCNCTKVIYELERYAELLNPNQPDRKSIIGDLMEEILARILSTQSKELPALIQSTIDLLESRNLVLYMHDTETQEALSALHWTGEVRATTGDYLYVVDSNFGGKKSNLYVTEDVRLDVQTSVVNKTTNTLSVTYSNPQANDGWLNHTYHAYIRIYVPEGSILKHSEGSVTDVTTIEELGKTVFESFVKVDPLGTSTLVFEYETPVILHDDTYSLLVQKQPGKNFFPYTLLVNGNTEESFTLSNDKELRIPLE